MQAKNKKLKKEVFKIKLNELLKQKRLEKGLSQRKLAELVGVQYQRIQEYEKERRAPISDNFLKIIKLLDIDLRQCSLNDENEKLSNSDK